ncbi:hypothetical protein [Ferrimonas sp. YFM]|uniref:hypothetical protein n=1 Tax=Ferrimonas sp. YFM TaxID=3028878 RepID=UPI002574293C|nr:hypothetical protein [Ferrimonas sp. YFM]BDY04360.1 hypothetical protein F0521_14010 [Ferrimonas sp. YFM]
MPKTAKPQRALVLVLMIWTANLSMLASQGLEEALHHHEAGVPCVHALLIDHWFQATGLSGVTWPASSPFLNRVVPELRPLVQPVPQNRGNRDPPIALS